MKKIFLFLLILFLFMATASFSAVTNTDRPGNKPNQAAGDKAAVIVETDPLYKEIRYSITDDDCLIKWIRYTSELNKGVLRHRSQCSLSLKDQTPLLSKILFKVLQDIDDPRSIHTFFVGRLAPDNAKGHLEMSRRLALAAKKSPRWDTEKGNPLTGHINEFVKEIANQEMIYIELKELFEQFDMKLEIASVEKVLVTTAGELPCFEWLKNQGVEAVNKVPYDCLTWFSIRVETPPEVFLDNKIRLN